MYCSSARGNEVPKKKSSHESALELARILVKSDTSWESTSAAVDSSTPTLHKYAKNSSVGSSKENGGGERLPSSNTEQQEHGSSTETGGGEGLVSSSCLPQVEEGGITPLFLATKSGCVEIVREILQTYPQAVEHIDKDGRTILHAAIKYRQLEVFNHVLKMEVAMRWLVRKLDNKENSILHMAGKKPSEYVPEKLEGPALELQEELLWFEVHCFNNSILIVYDLFFMGA